jgi:glycosyltransferase involved in cell wall biosynthesis
VDLELLIPTFNRAESLRDTLERLAASPFATCRTTVLDNASPDATPQVCAELAPRFADLRVVRHPRNLGGVANLLRAFELPEATYAWVLADDDDLDFSDCADVVGVLEDGRADLVSLGAPGRDGWPNGELTTARALLRTGRRFFHVFGFVPNTVYRTALFDGDALAEGYLEAGHYYPHFPFLRRLVEDHDASVYVSRTEVVRRRGLARPSSELDWLLNWVRTCETIRDRRLRAQVVAGTTATPLRWFLGLGGAIALERLHRPDRVWRQVAELALLLRGRQRAQLLAAAPAGLLPPAVLRPLLAHGARRSGVVLEVEETLRTG